MSLIFISHSSSDADEARQLKAELEKLIDTLKDAYETRLKRKFAADEAKMQKLMELATGSSALGILRQLKDIDDDER